MGGDDLYRRRRFDTCEVVFDPDMIGQDAIEKINLSLGRNLAVTDIRHSAQLRSLD